MIRTAILDDEPLAVELLTDYVQKTAGLELVEAGTDPFKVLQLLQQQAIDLVLLDIQMPELTGIQFMKIAGHQCKIIVTTAYPEYAMDGYEFSITDYLLKPFSYERFCKAIDKLKENILLATTANTTVSDGYIFVKSEYKLVRVDFSHIRYIESLRDYVAIHTLNDGKLMTLDSLRNMEEILPPDNFVRVHKSFIVAINKIQYVERSRIVINDQYIPIGDSYQEKFFERIKRG